MITLISDIGSSKSSWALISQNDISTFETKGFNPNYQSETEITDILTEVFDFFESKKIDQLFLYGAGIDTSKSKNILNGSVISTGIVVNNIFMENDLLAAARCSFDKNENGVIAILGTGSNIREYQNALLKGESNSLGYILGDEGGGVGFGRLICKAFVYGDLTENISEILRNNGFSKESIINAIYHEPFPQKYLANFARVLFNYKNDASIQAILIQNFENFIQSHVLKIENIQNKDLRFVGSMAYYFQDELKETATKHNLKISTIHQNPLEGLIEYHKRQL